jgi:hypothetical protein
MSSPLITYGRSNFNKTKSKFASGASDDLSSDDGTPTSSLSPSKYEDKDDTKKTTK